MIFDCSSKKAYLTAPVVFALCVLALLVTWLVMEPAALRHMFDGASFDQDGHSAFELATIPFYAAIIPLVWWKCPFTGSRRRRILLCAAVSCVAFMAIVKELDWHLIAMERLFPSIVGSDGNVHASIIGPDGNMHELVKPNGARLTGTPFKMRFLTNGDVPFTAKLCVLFYFGAFFGVFVALLAYYAVPIFKGFFRFHPAAWSVCFFGGSGVIVAVMDRLPAWYRHTHGLGKEQIINNSFGSFCTCFEEGGEMMIAIFALLAILQAHAIYTRQIKPHCDL